MVQWANTLFCEDITFSVNNIVRLLLFIVVIVGILATAAAPHSDTSSYVRLEEAL